MPTSVSRHNLAVVKTLTYAMFAMFAMTTDSVGLIIPEIIKQFRLTLTAAGTFQYATMAGIAVAALCLGTLADRLGRRRTIVIGLTMFAAASFLFAAGRSFPFFVGLMALSGLAIGVFKTGALALVGDISTSTTEHTSIMNTVEGFFSVGSIVGPAVLAYLLAHGVAWQWLYVVAGTMCASLIVVALSVTYPTSAKPADAPRGQRGTMDAVRNPYVLGFSAGLFLYVGVEAAIYVWMPTLLANYRGRAAWLAVYGISIFFALRAAGRFLGAWMLLRWKWQAAVAILSGAIFACFALSVAGGVAWAVYLLPASGLFMAMIYPTLNSKGISCVAKDQHGAAAGVLLFFTCLSAVTAPLAMGALSDVTGQIVYGFWLATGLAALLFGGLLVNWLANPTRVVLARLDATDYGEHSSV
jgi:fucose permease